MLLLIQLISLQFLQEFYNIDLIEKICLYLYLLDIPYCLDGGNL